jgi:hypothetical protein
MREDLKLKACLLCGDVPTVHHEDKIDFYSHCCQLIKWSCRTDDVEKIDMWNACHESPDTKALERGEREAGHIPPTEKGDGA